MLYLVNRAEGIFVLHAFEKRTRRTRQADLAIARHNLAGIRPRES